MRCQRFYGRDRARLSFPRGSALWRFTEILSPWTSGEKLSARGGLPACTGLDSGRGPCCTCPTPPRARKVRPLQPPLLPVLGRVEVSVRFWGACDHCWAGQSQQAGRQVWPGAPSSFWRSGARIEGAASGDRGCVTLPRKGAVYLGFTYLFERRSQREGEKDLTSLVYSPHGSSRRGRARLQPGTLNSTWVSRGSGRGPSTRACSAAFPGAAAGSWVGSSAAGT